MLAHPAAQQNAGALSRAGGRAGVPSLRSAPLRSSECCCCPCCLPPLRGKSGQPRLPARCLCVVLLEPSLARSHPAIAPSHTRTRMPAAHHRSGRLRPPLARPRPRGQGDVHVGGAEGGDGRGDGAGRHGVPHWWVQFRGGFTSGGGDWGGERAGGRLCALAHAELTHMHARSHACTHARISTCSPPPVRAILDWRTMRACVRTLLKKLADWTSLLLAPSSTPRLTHRPDPANPHTNTQNTHTQERTWATTAAATRCR